jgi:uncharacterized membrane protein (DUF106 family)
MPAGIIQALLSAISGIFGAINNVFGAKNTPEMKKAQEQQKEANFSDEIEEAVKEKNVKKIRDILSE